MTTSPGDWQQQMIAVLPKLRRFAFALTGSPEDADDLMQMTIEKALVKADQFQPGTRMDNWLFRICKNRWIDEWRKTDRQARALEANKDMFETHHDGERAAMQAIGLSEVNRAMAQLGPAQRQIISLVAIEGKTYQQTATILQIPIGTVMSRLARARAALASQLERYAPDDGAALKKEDGHETSW